MHKQKAELFSSNQTNFSHAIDNEALFRMGAECHFKNDVVPNVIHNVHPNVIINDKFNICW